MHVLFRTTIHNKINTGYSLSLHLIAGQVNILERKYGNIYKNLIFKCKSVIKLV